MTATVDVVTTRATAERGAASPFAGYEIIEQWWKGLEHNKKERAFLRRCANLHEVMQAPYMWSVWARLQAADVRVGDKQLAMVLALLARVRNVRATGDKTLPQAFAIKKNGKPTLSTYRFHRLLRCRNRDEVFRPLASALRIVDTSQITLASLASALWYWESGSLRWAKEYYTAAL